MAIKFAEFTDAERVAAERITARAARMAVKHGQHVDRLGLYMDLAATHAQCPLLLDELAAAADVDFAHDVWGIMRHMDRTTGRLGGFFLPRYAAPDAPGDRDGPA